MSTESVNCCSKFGDCIASVFECPVNCITQTFTTCTEGIYNRLSECPINWKIAIVVLAITIAVLAFAVCFLTVAPPAALTGAVLGGVKIGLYASEFILGTLLGLSIKMYRDKK